MPLKNSRTYIRSRKKVSTVKLRCFHTPASSAKFSIAYHLLLIYYCYNIGPFAVTMTTLTTSTSWWRFSELSRKTWIVIACTTTASYIVLYLYTGDVRRHNYIGEKKIIIKTKRPWTYLTIVRVRARICVQVWAMNNSAVAIVDDIEWIIIIYIVAQTNSSSISAVHCKRQ